MRLTLRTMLAYLDDILEPADTEDIGKKIEESDFATNLVHRTRDVMRRLRLGVPALVGRGLGADPNTVAEYLDNTLPADRVPEFEKVCLESDVHLAEVAACHQVLTLVLGEPAEVEPRVRQRMYALATQVEAPPVQSDAAPTMTAAAQVPVQPPPRRAKPEVPDYLREQPRRRFWPVAATLIIAALLTCGALAYFSPGEWRQRTVALLGLGEISTEEDGEADASAEANSLAPADAAPTNDNTEPDAAETAHGEPAPPVESRQPHGAADSPTADSAIEPPAPEPLNETEMPAEPTEEDVASAAPVGDPVGDVPTGTRPTEIAAPEQPDEDLAAEANNADGESFGRLISKREVLLRFDSAAGEWKRVRPTASLVKGDRLLSLPAFRPSITLSSNLSIEADGPATWELVGRTATGVPMISVADGRLILLTLGKAGNQLQLKIGDREALLTFVDADSSVALEIRRALPPGKDPEMEPGILNADLYATSGAVRVREGESEKPIELQGPARHALFLPKRAQGADEEFPKWVTADGASDVLDHRAIAVVEPALAGNPVVLTLRELAEHRQREVRSLAVRSACYLGDFEAAIKAINDKRDKADWTSYVDELRAAIARNPETSAQVRAALEQQRGQDGPGLYRMLWGYSADDLKNGEARKLVDALNHDSLDYRVLGIYNLQQIEGGTLSYRPEDTAIKRKTPVATWERRLKEGKIVPHPATSKSRGGKSGRTS